MNKLYGCNNCGSYFLYPDLNEYDEPSYCPECGSSDWESVEDMELRSIRRKNDYKKAVRKRNIVLSWGSDWSNGYYDNLHQYSKNKIHCSCPLCRAKTSKIKMRKSCGSGRKNWTMSDQKRIEEMRNELVEFQMLGEVSD